MGKNYHTDNKSFLFYKDWEEYLDMLDSDEEIVQLVRALIAFAARGEEPELTGNVKVIYKVMRKAIEHDGREWEAVCERNRKNSKKRWDKDDTTECDRIDPHTVDADKDKDKEKEKDKDKDKDKERDKEVTAPGGAPAPTPSNNKIYKNFGEYGNVRLTDDEYNRLIENNTKTTALEYIKRCDEYCELKGKEYGSYYLAIVSWIRKDEEDGRLPPLQVRLDEEKWAGIGMQPLPCELNNT